MPRLSDQQYQDLLKSEGGFSINDPTGEWPAAGSMTSRWGSERSFSGVPAAEEIGSYRKDYRQPLSEPGAFFGGWKTEEEEGTVRTDLDVSDQIPTAQQAQEVGRQRGQEAYFDLGKMGRKIKATGEEYGGTQIEHGPAPPGGYVKGDPGQAREDRRVKNTAYRHSVREHLRARESQPQTHDELRAAGERVGGAVYDAEQTRQRVGRRGTRSGV